MPRPPKNRLVRLMWPPLGQSDTAHGSEEQRRLPTRKSTPPCPANYTSASSWKISPTDPANSLYLIATATFDALDRRRPPDRVGASLSNTRDNAPPLRRWR